MGAGDNDALDESVGLRKPSLRSNRQRFSGASAVESPLTVAELQEIVAAFNEHNLDKIMSCFADCCKL